MVTKATHSPTMEKKRILVSDEIKERCPGFIGTAVHTDIENSEYSQELWKEIDKFIQEFRDTYTTDSIKHMPAIEATRLAYRKCGKDPSRYRPSSEALIRRTLQGKELYQIDTAVDLINLASMKYGYSIGGFDFDKIAGDTLTLGIGCEGEPYEGIGRGPFNIAGLPIYRDDYGGIGTPTSDHERTKMELGTRRMLAVVNGYDGNKERVTACAEFIIELVKRYAHGTNASYDLFE